MKLEHELGINQFVSEQQKAVVNVLFTSSWVHKRINRYLKPYQITQEQFNVLRILKGALPDTLCAKDISERMIDKGSNVTRIIDKLVLKKLVERQPSITDRREVRVEITKNGLNLLETISDIKINSESNFLNELESQLLNVLLDKMRDQGTL